MSTDVTRPTDDEVWQRVRNQCVEGVHWYDEEGWKARTEALQRILSRPAPAKPIAAEPGEVERVAKALYQCEKERSDHVDRLLSAAKGQPVKFRMEHWDDVADLYRSDARAALATLTAPEPRAAGEGALADELADRIRAIWARNTIEGCITGPLSNGERYIVLPYADYEAHLNTRFDRGKAAALRQPSTDRESVRKEALTSDFALYQRVANETSHAEDCELRLDLGPRTNLCSCDHAFRTACSFYALTAQPHAGKEQE